MYVDAFARGGALALADHITNSEDNEEIRIVDACGVTSDEPHRALAEMVAMQRGWRGGRPIVHGKLSPESAMSEAEWDKARLIYEKIHGLEGQPYIIVEHKKGFRPAHRHFVHLRYNPEQKKGVHMGLSYAKDEAIARIIEYDCGHERVSGKHERAVMEILGQLDRPDVAMWISDTKRKISGLSTDFSTHQQQKRGSVSHDQVAATVFECWKCDGAKTFQNALAKHGFVLANGDSTKKDGSPIAVVVFRTKSEQQFISLDRALARILKKNGQRKGALNFEKFDFSKLALPTVQQAKEALRDRQEYLGNAPIPTLDEVVVAKADRRADGLKKREEARAVWKAARAQHYEAAKKSLLDEYRAAKSDKFALKTAKWEEKKAQDKAEREALKSKLSGQRNAIYGLFSRGLMRSAFLVLHRWYGDSKWLDLKAQQRDRTAELKNESRIISWREWLAGCAAFGDSRAILLSQRFTCKSTPLENHDGQGQSRSLYERYERIRDNGRTGDEENRGRKFGSFSATGSQATERLSGVPNLSRFGLASDKKRSPLFLLTSPADQLVQPGQARGFVADVRWASPSSRVILPGLNLQAASAEEKAAVKAEFGVTWNKAEKVWEAPANHPKLAEALAQYGTAPAATASKEASAKTAAAATVPQNVDRFVMLPNEKKGPGNFMVVDTQIKDAKDRPTIAGFINPGKEGSVLRAYDGKTVGAGPLSDHDKKVVDVTQPLTAQLITEAPVQKTASKAVATEPVVGKPKLWQNHYSEDAKAKIMAEIKATPNDQLLANIAATKVALAQPAPDDRKRGLTLGLGQLEAEAVARNLIEPKKQARPSPSRGWRDQSTSK